MNDQILNEFYPLILPLVEEINHKYIICPCCGNDFFNGDRCSICHFKNKDLEVPVKKLKTILASLQKIFEQMPIKKMEYNHLFTLLAKIKGNRIAIVEELFLKYHYYDVLNNIYFDIEDKFYDNIPLNDREIDVSEALIYQNSTRSLAKKRNIKQIELLASTFVKNAIMNGLIPSKLPMISYDAFKELIRVLAEDLIAALYPDSLAHGIITGRCIIKDVSPQSHDKIVRGEAIYNKITLYDGDIKAMYYDGDDDLLETIFHEVTHVEQVLTYNDPIISKACLLQIKDRILSKFIPGYYEENYNNISYEIEASYRGLLNKKYCINSLGFHFLKDAEVKMNNQLQDYVKRANNTERTIKGIPIDITVEFEKILATRPFLLEYYRALENFYTVKDGQVVRKSKSELQYRCGSLLARNLSRENKERCMEMFALYGISVDEVDEFLDDEIDLLASKKFK